MTARREGFAAFAGAAALVLAGCAGGTLPSLENVLAGLPSGGGSLDTGTIVAGLREALQVGTRNAVATTSRLDGYWGNPGIRIPLPGSLESMATALRGLGMRSQVDELELAMNRAAERAASEASDVFLGAIRRMTFADARGILEGDDTAATAWFRRTSEDELRTRYAPIVDEKLTDVGLVRLYDDLVDRYAALPFTRRPALDLRDYVTGAALDGLFSVLGDEERRIRQDPAARTTQLLRTVFGSS